MENKLTLEYLAPYLPYKLNCQYQLADVIFGSRYEIREKVLEADNVKFVLSYCKPILRPISDFTKIHDNNEGSLYAMTFNIAQLDIDSDLDINIGDYGDTHGTAYLPIIKVYDTFQILLKYHLDVFGLIEKGLAIDINTLQK